MPLIFFEFTVFWKAFDFMPCLIIRLITLWAALLNLRRFHNNYWGQFRVFIGSGRVIRKSIILTLNYLNLVVGFEHVFRRFTLAFPTLRSGHNWFSRFLIYLVLVAPFYFFVLNLLCLQFPLFLSFLFEEKLLLLKLFDFLFLIPIFLVAGKFVFE